MSQESLRANQAVLILGQCLNQGRISMQEYLEGVRAIESMNRVINGLDDVNGAPNGQLQ